MAVNKKYSSWLYKTEHGELKRMKLINIERPNSMPMINVANRFLLSKHKFVVHGYNGYTVEVQALGSVNIDGKCELSDQGDG